MSRIFLSHSSENNAEAVALRDWLGSHGWDDLFLGLDPERGLKAGERWQAALKQAAERCELVIFLVSPECVRLAACLCLPDVAFLRRTGLSRSRLKRLVAEGLPLHGSKIDHAEALKWIEGAVDPARKDNWQGDATLNNLRRAREPPRPRRAARRPTTAWVIIGSGFRTSPGEMRKCLAAQCTTRRLLHTNADMCTAATRRCSYSGLWFWLRRHH